MKIIPTHIYHLETLDFNLGTKRDLLLTSIIFTRHHIYTLDAFFL